MTRAVSSPVIEEDRARGYRPPTQRPGEVNVLRYRPKARKLPSAKIMRSATKLAGQLGALAAGTAEGSLRAEVSSRCANTRVTPAWSSNR